MTSRHAWRWILPVLGLGVICAEPVLASVPPVANNQSASMAVKSTNYWITLNYTDLDGGAMTFTLVTAPTKGFMSYPQGSGSQPLLPGVPVSVPYFYYNSTGTVAGADSFTWRVSDGTATSAVATVSITLTANNAPVASSGSASFALGSYRYQFYLSPTHADSYQPMSFQLDTLPTNGIMEWSTDNGVTYTSVAANVPISVGTHQYCLCYYTSTNTVAGPDSFSWQVSDSIVFSQVATESITLVANVVPVANNQSLTVAENASPQLFAYSVVHPDSYQIMRYLLRALPAHGVVYYSINDLVAPTNTPIANNSWYYQPATGYVGSDSWLWCVSDGMSTSGWATVSITIPSNSPPQAMDQGLSLLQNSSRGGVTLNGHDQDAGQTQIWTLVTAPLHGTLEFFSSGYCSLLSGFSAATASWYYTPTPGYTGMDAFVWNLNDGCTNSRNATCAITVLSNNPPVIVKSLTTVSCLKNSANNDMTAFLNYAHPDTAQAMTFMLVSAPASGTLTAGGSTLHAGDTAGVNNWLYTPNTNFTGADGFIWNVSDGIATSSNATIAINVIPAPAPGQPPRFKAGVPLMDGTNAMRLWRQAVNGKYDYAGFATNANMAAPELADWNNDGLMDLVVGEADGRIALFLNQGTKGHPIFHGYRYLTFQNGHEIRSWFGNCQCFGGGPECSAPRVVDWDNDGRKDLIVGEWAAASMYQPPNLFVFLNEGSDEAPVFTERFISTSRNEVFCPKMNCRLNSPSGVPVSMPCVADWNGDGIADLISGDNPGWGPTPNGYGFPSLTAPSATVNVFLGTKNDHGPGGNLANTSIVNAEIYNWNEYTPSDSFQTISPAFTLTNVCPVGSRKSVVMADWTGTGRKDLIVGMQGGTICYSINVGTPNFPLFTNYTRLQVGGIPVVVGDPTKTNSDLAGYNGTQFYTVSNLRPLNEARIAVGDLDGDGLMDLVVGTADGSLFYFQQYNPNPVAIDQQVIVMTSAAKNITLGARVDSSNAVTYTVLTNPTNGHLSGTAPNLVYTPNAGYNGADSLTFTVHDTVIGSNATGTIRMTIKAHPPTAQWTSPVTLSSTAIVSMNQPCPITLSATDAGDESLTYTCTQPAHGTLSGAAPNLIYTPATNYSGRDSFTYKANDGYLDSNVATVNLDVCVLAVNFQPTATPVPAGYVKDDGSLTNSVRGYGWSMNLTNSANFLNSNPDPRMDTYVASATSATWSCTLSNGAYFVSLGSGYWSSGEGKSADLFNGYTQQAVDSPQHQDIVTVQGSNVVSNATISAMYTAAGSRSYVYVGKIPAIVTNNQLTVTIGGTTAVTRLNFVEIRNAYQTAGSATFVTQDATTQGSWIGTYGGDGYFLCAGNIFMNALTTYTLVPMKLPSYALISGPTSASAFTIPWAMPTNDLRGLQYPTDDPQMSGYWSVLNAGKNLIFDVNLTDGLTHRVAVYCTSWNNTTWAETLDILDADNNTVLNSQPMSGYGTGKYLVWNLQGHVKIRATCTSGYAAVSGIFFGDCAAPAILVQPLDDEVEAGQTAVFDVIASGSPLAYAWQRSGDFGATWTTIPGATSDSYALATVVGDNGAAFRCVVSNAYGMATSDPAMLTASTQLPPPPVITSPLNITANLNSSFSYQITALNNPVFFYAPMPPLFTLDELGGIISSYSTCVLTGSASTWYYNTGVMTIPISAINAGGIDAENLMITINGATAPVINGVLTATGAVGSPFSYQILAYVTTNPVSSYSAVGLPQGLSLNTTNGTISGQPTSAAVGTTLVTIGAKNSEGTGIALLAISINSTPGEADIVTQPANTNVNKGQTATFRVAAAGNPALTYQWRKNGVNISGATSMLYTTPVTLATDNGALFSVIVSNPVNYVISSNATLTLNAVPVITLQPSNCTVTAGQAAQFNVTATGTAPLFYQWRTNGIAVALTTNAWYSTAITSTNDNGRSFVVMVTNVAGCVTSAPPAVLTVKRPLCFQSAATEASGFGMNFLTDTGTVYDVFWRTNLLLGGWQLYTNLNGSGSNAHVCFTNTLPQAFFQIKTE